MMKTLPFRKLCVHLFEITSHSSRRKIIVMFFHCAVVLCLRLDSGDDGGALVDGSRDQCLTVPQSPDGVSIHYELFVNSQCGNGRDVIVKVTMDLNADCNDLVSTLSVKESEDNCSRNSMKMKRCSLMESIVDSDKKVCRLRCKCADTADSCLLQIYSRGLIPNPTEIKICEIQIETP